MAGFREIPLGYYMKNSQVIRVRTKVVSNNSRAKVTLHCLEHLLIQCLYVIRLRSNAAFSLKICNLMSGHLKSINML